MLICFCTLSAHFLIAFGLCWVLPLSNTTCPGNEPIRRLKLETQKKWAQSLHTDEITVLNLVWLKQYKIANEIRIQF